MIRNYFFLVLTMVSLTTVRAQSGEEKQRGIAIGLGFRTLLINDEIGSNLNYQGSTFSFHVQHEVVTETQARDFNAFISTPRIENEFNSNSMDGVFIFLDYHWRFRLNVALPWDLSWYVGPYLRTSGFYRNFNFDLQRIEVTTGDVYGSLGVSSLMQKRFEGDRSLQLLLSAPVINYVINREFIGSTTEDWLFPDRFADYQLRLMYSGRTLKSADWFLAYQYQVVIIDRSTRVAHEGHLFETGLKFSF